MADFGKFIQDRGWEFKTEDEAKAAYDQLWKVKHDIMLTAEEFAAEAKDGDGATRETYNALAALVEAGKLRAADVYQYARFHWCLDMPEAILAYQAGRDQWEVNNCDTEVCEDQAKIAVNLEWGFEASRIKIIGIPYYAATDYHFIRFDCAHMSWLWKNGTLHQVYA